MAARLAEPKISVETYRATLTSLKEGAAHADTEKDDCENVVAESREESEQKMVCLIVVIVGRNWSEKLAQSFVTQSFNALDAVVQQLGYNALSWIRQGLKRSYSTVCVPCPAPLTCSFVVAT